MSVKTPIRDLKDNYYLSVIATFFRTRDDAFLISAANLFHKVAATLDEQLPSMIQLNKSTIIKTTTKPLN